MSEQTNTETAEKAATGDVQLNGLFAFKVGMSAIYEEGERIPVTILKYEPMVVSQVKTKEKDGYASVQVAFVPSRATRVTSAQKKKLSKAGFENGAKFVRELRTESAAEVGQKVALETLKKGDTIKITARSRGRGFSGAVERWNFNGGPASHGSGFHRKPGSVGNRTWPGRVIPGKRMAGQYGDETVTIKNAKVVEVIAEENVLMVRGSVPGARNSLVRLMKV
jgi:large subunit ribosomal protein L3